MSFFTDSTTQEVVNKHIDQIESLEEKKARELISKYREIRREMRDRLDALPRDTFTAQRLRGVLVQVEAAILKMNEGLQSGMADAGKEVSYQSIRHLEGEINKFNKQFTGAVIPIDVDAVSISLETENNLFNQYEASISAYSEAVRADISRGLTQAAIEQVSPAELVRRLSQFFLQEEWKLHRIVRTELHNIYNLSKQTGMGEIKDEYIPDLKKTLFHPMDNRTGEDSIQAARANLIVNIDEPFVYIYTRTLKNGSTVKEKRVFMTPPDRPNDRSILIPYRKEWES